MNNAGRPRVIVLKTGIFPDETCMQQAIELMEGDCQVQWEDLTSRDMDAAEWDRVLSDILSSEKVISV